LRFFFHCILRVLFVLHLFDSLKFCKFLIIDSYCFWITLEFIFYSLQNSFIKILCIFLKKERFYSFFFFIHNGFISKLCFNSRKPLNICISYSTIFIWVTLFNFFGPFNAIELQVKFQDKQRMNHIDKSEANTTLSLEVFW